MDLPLANFICAACAGAFEAPTLPDSAYGEFLLWSRNGNFAYLNALEDETFNEVSDLLAQHPALKGASASRRAAVLHQVYGRLACDKDSQGAAFEIGAGPGCPACLSTGAHSWDFSDPPRMIDVSSHMVSHKAWSPLSQPEKEKALADELSSLKLRGRP